MISLGRFVRYFFSKSSNLSPSLSPWRPAIQGLELYFVFLFYIPFCQPVPWGRRFGFSGIYHVNFFCAASPGFKYRFLSITYGKDGGEAGNSGCPPYFI